MSALVDGAEILGLHLSAGQLAQLDQFQAALRDWNGRVNLVSRTTTPADLETKHVLDSLTLVQAIGDRLAAHPPARLVDVGAGAGFPSIPLKIAFPHLRITLVESVGKKAAFLSHVVQSLGLRDVEVLAERAEAASRRPGHRDAYDVAVARALGSLPAVVELCAPFLAPGGLMVAPRKGRVEADLLAAAPAFGALKMWARAPIAVTVPPLNDGRVLMLGEKYAATPEKYPRRPGLAKKEPLRR